MAILSSNPRIGTKVFIEAETISSVKKSSSTDGFEAEYVSVRIRGMATALMVPTNVLVEPPKQEFALTGLDMDTTRSRISTNIREYRQRANLSQTSLGELIGVSQNAVSQWENGYCTPRFYVVPALCGALGISTEDLYGDLKND